MGKPYFEFLLVAVGDESEHAIVDGCLELGYVVYDCSCSWLVVVVVGVEVCPSAVGSDEVEYVAHEVAFLPQWWACVSSAFSHEGCISLLGMIKAPR